LLGCFNEKRENEYCYNHRTEEDIMDDQSQDIQVGTKYDKGKNPQPITIHVPADQAWMWYALNEQYKKLKSINTAVTFLAIVVLIGIVMAGCNAIISAGALR
jgi:hypothetical protein